MSPDSDLDALLTVSPIEGGRARVAIPPTWQQGRGAFGGLVTGLLTSALEASAPGRPLRSLTAELCGPTQPGDATLELDVLRAGNAVTTTAIRLVQNGEVQAHAVGVLGAPRGDRADAVALAPPALPPWQAVPPLPVVGPLAPEFAQHIEMRATGPLPFSGGARAEVAGWVRPRRPGVRRDAAYLAACIDAYWPALFTVLRAPRPMATIAFTFQPLLPADLVLGDAPLFSRNYLLAEQGGYCVEQRELWHESGRLVALNQQTFVVIK